MRRKVVGRVGLIALLVAGLIAGGLYYYAHQPGKRLTEKDTIILIDFANSTGDAIFDDTLKTALSVSLRRAVSMVVQLETYGLEGRLWIASSWLTFRPERPGAGRVCMRKINVAPPLHVCYGFAPQPLANAE